MAIGKLRWQRAAFGSTAMSMNGGLSCAFGIGRLGGYLAKES
jgi:hypothetical protein